MRKHATHVSKTWNILLQISTLLSSLELLIAQSNLFYNWWILPSYWTELNQQIWIMTMRSSYSRIWICLALDEFCIIDTATFLFIIVQLHWNNLYCIKHYKNITLLWSLWTVVLWKRASKILLLNYIRKNNNLQWHYRMNILILKCHTIIISYDCITRGILFIIHYIMAI